MTQFTKGQWPDDICSGYINYSRSHNTDGFCLSDSSHGIPTFSSVSPANPPTIRGQFVQVFNYPKQTEAIAERLVLCWNACVGKTNEQLKAMIEAKQKPKPMTLHEAQMHAKEKGFKLSKCVDKEYRVCPVDEDERSAYYTTDLQDAIDTINNWR